MRRASALAVLVTSAVAVPTIVFGVALHNAALSRDCIESWNARARRDPPALRDGFYRRATFGTWREGGSDTGRPQCFAMFSASDGKAWALFATRGDDREWA